MDLVNSQPSAMKSSCELPLSRAPTPSHSEPHYTSHRPPSTGLYKSASSNNIPSPVHYYPGRGGQLPTRPWRYPSSSVSRPVGVPFSISQQSLSSRVACQCQCDGSRKQVSFFVLLPWKWPKSFYFFVSEKGESPGRVSKQGSTEFESHQLPLGNCWSSTRKNSRV
jgi:hypothetical protein